MFLYELKFSDFHIDSFPISRFENGWINWPGWHWCGHDLTKLQVGENAWHWIIWEGENCRAYIDWS